MKAFRFCLLPIALICGCSPPSAQQVARQKDEDAAEAQFGSKVDAILHAQKAVKAVLKHPHDASFDWFPAAVLSNPANGRRSWTVVGTVEAKNDFGGTLTNEYSATLECRGGAWSTLIVTLDKETQFVDEAKLRDLVESAEQFRAAAASAPPQPSEPVAEAPAPERTPSTMPPKPVDSPKVVDGPTPSPSSATAPVNVKPLFRERDWKLADGKSFRGALKSFGAGKLKIIETSGVAHELRASDLSRDDQLFIQTNWID